MMPAVLLRRTPPKPTRQTPPAPEVSVCIVNWNGRDMLRDCLDSLVHHRQGVPTEIIVVDNASTDGAADMVEREFPDVILIRNNDNVGYARANNLAARWAHGRYLFFLNNDTLVPPETLAQLIEEADRDPEVGIIAPRLRDGRGRIQVSCRAFPTVGALLHRTCLFRWTGLFRRAYRRYRWRERDLESRRRVDVVMGAALLVNRVRFWRSGGWDEAFTFGGEDIDLCARIGQDHAVIFYPDAEVIHYGRVSSRERIEYAHGQTLIGITRYLRKSGTSRAAMLIYKLSLTFDAPMRLLGALAQYVTRRIRGESKAATKSWRVVKALAHFARHDLCTLWKV